MFFEKNVKCSAQYKLSSQFAIFKIPKIVMLSLCLILLFSILCLYSADGGSMYPWAIRQLLYIFLSIIIFVILININIDKLYKLAYPLLMLSIFLLAITMVIGKHAMGASRWINFGYFSFQPSEFAKITVVLALAKFFSRINPKDITNFVKSTFFAILLISPVIGLVAIQPDLATSIVILIVCAIMLFVIGISKKQFIFVGLSIISFMPIAWFKLLKEYQKLRIINFFIPENDPFGSGYNIIQSKIAIGSGGIVGKGFLEGTQGKLHFLPEHHTDFIFTSVGEEWGLIGSIVLIVTYLYIVFYGFSVVQKINSIFCKLIIIGCTALIFVHMFINIGMTVGLMPVAGIPLMMMSYGGSSLLLGISCIALMVNIDIHQQNINFTSYY